MNPGALFSEPWPALLASEPRKQRLLCYEGDFWFINSCEELTKHFKCERGCGVELGADVPNYVVDPALSNYQRCLVNQAQPKCRARHVATARLCPCAPDLA
jgi:hypothetical protein